jgi:hypothetical protein
MSDDKKMTLGGVVAGLWLMSMPFAAIFIFFMAFAWYEEKNYRWWGEEAQAQVVDVKVDKHYRRRGGSYEDLEVSFQFQDQGTTRIEKVNLDPDSLLIPSVGDKITVEYVPGKKKYARIQGMNRSLEITVLYSLMAYSVLGGVMTIFVLRGQPQVSPPSYGRPRYR